MSTPLTHPPAVFHDMTQVRTDVLRAMGAYQPGGEVHLHLHQHIHHAPPTPDPITVYPTPVRDPGWDRAHYAGVHHRTRRDVRRELTSAVAAPFVVAGILTTWWFIAAPIAAFLIPILGGLLVTVVVFGLLSMLGSKTVCPGIHCPGCK